MEKKIIYHGSDKEIEKPLFGYGKPYNDYGLGFYCTESLDLAKEWACADEDNKGYANRYEIDLEGLKILDLSSDEYSILNWMAVLVKFRTFDTSSAISKRAKEFLLANYYVDVSQYDVVIGYRADDSYFRFARDFLNNTISVEKLSKAMKLGELGKQIVLISRKAFSSLRFLGSEAADSRIYYERRRQRDIKAREAYESSYKDYDADGEYINDIMRKETKDAD